MPTSPDGGFVATTQIKGGSSKTSIAATLVSWLKRQGQQVVALDLDPQRSLTRWLASAEPDIPLVLPDEDNHDERGAALDACEKALEVAPWVIADPPPSSSTMVRVLVAAADTVVIPSSANIEELYLADRVSKMAIQEGRHRSSPARRILVFVRIDPRTTLAQGAATYARDELDAEVAETVLRHRIAWPESMSDGRSIFDMPASKAAEAQREAEALCREILGVG